MSILGQKNLKNLKLWLLAVPFQVALVIMVPMIKEKVNVAALESDEIVSWCAALN